MELAKVHREHADARSSLTGMGQGAVHRCADCLRQARDLLNDLLAQVRLEDEDLVRQLRQESAELNFMLGEYYEQRERNLEYAIGYYGETLRNDDTHEKSIMALARIHLQNNELDICEKQLMTLLRVDPTNEEASMLMAELMMMLAAQGGRSDGGAQEYQDATFHYQTLLDKKPCNYTALSKLIFLLRRAGRLRDAPRYITAAENACARSPDQEAGLRFCRGTHFRLAGLTLLLGWSLSLSLACAGQFFFVPGWVSVGARILLGWFLAGSYMVHGWRLAGALLDLC